MMNELMNTVKGLYNWQRQAKKFTEVKITVVIDGISSVYVRDKQLDISGNVNDAAEIDLQKWINEHKPSKLDNFVPFSAGPDWKVFTKEDRLRELENQQEKMLDSEDENIWDSFVKHTEPVLQWLQNGNRVILIHLENGKFSNNKFVPYFFEIEDIDLDASRLVNSFDESDNLESVYGYMLNIHQLEHEIKCKCEEFEEGAFGFATLNMVDLDEEELYEELGLLVNKYKATLEQSVSYYENKDEERCVKAKGKLRNLNLVLDNGEGLKRIAEGSLMF